MQLIHLHPYFDKLQQKYGNNNLNAIYNAGQIINPIITFVFMNPTAQNIATHKNRKGIRALGYLIFLEISSKCSQKS